MITSKHLAVMFTLFLQEEYWEDDIMDWPVQDNVQRFSYIVSHGLSHEHGGDCTDAPITCLKCVVEDLYLKANEIIEALG
jgi:hypothetical protein